MQQHYHEPEQRQMARMKERPNRFWWILLIILAALGAIYFYLIPFLASSGVGGNNPSSGGWSAAQQQQIAFTLAQQVQDYRQRIYEARRINYGDAYLTASGIAQPFRPKQPVEGMNAPNPPQNDTHSETMLKGWALYIIRKNLQSLPSGSVINILIFTQVKVCPDCRRDIQTWAKQLQQAASTGVVVNLYI